MYFQFLIEDESGKILVQHIMEKIQSESPSVEFDCKAFKGIGGLKLTSGLKDVKTNKLLNDLRIYLRGFDRSLRGIDAAIFVVVDNDKREMNIFRRQLDELAVQAMISIDYVFCIAVEEMEAWLLGDREALLSAYPKAKEVVLKEYEQDSICGTWEVLANAVYKGGLSKMKRDCLTYWEIGRNKAEWADKIGRCMTLDKNVSPSFNYFVQELRARIDK